MRTNKIRLNYIDVLNCIAIFFVLVLHSAQLAHFGEKNSPNYLLATILQALCIPAVFIFFMNSGATLLTYRKRQTTAEFAKRRFLRVGIPFLFWSVAYYFFDAKFRAFPGPSDHSAGISFASFIKAFLNNDINNLFWFFYAIIALYLVTPIFSVLVDKHKAVLSYVVCIYFFFNDVLGYLSHVTGHQLVTQHIAQPLLTSSWLGFFLMGYLIRENYFSKKVQNILIFSGLLTLSASIADVITGGKYIFLSGYSSFLYSVALYLIVKRVVAKVNNEKILHSFQVFSGASLGIYILHPLFYAFFDKMIFKTSVRDWPAYLGVLSSLVHILVLPVIAYFVLTLCVLLIKKIRLGRILIP